MRIQLALVVAAALALSACGGVTSPSSNTVENFTGTLSINVGDTKIHTFSASKTGELSVVIQSLTPTPATTTYFGVYLGLSQNGGCSVYQSNTFAILGQQALGGTINSGNYCVMIADVGYLRNTTQYSLKVSHP